LLNAQLKLRTADDHYGVTIWGRNLANRYYYTANYSYASYGFDTPVLGDPRTYGLSVDARF
jgi:iron complex outermembrane recepter protein